MQSSTFYGAFTVSGSQRSKWYINENKDVPSTKYNVHKFEDKPSAPKHKIGNGPRSSIVDKRKLPGPGKYENDIGKQNYTKGVKMLGKNYIEPTYDDVSPTKYNPKTHIITKTQPSFSFTIRQGEVWSKDTPGPNHYFKNQNDNSMYSSNEKRYRSQSQQKNMSSSMNDIDQSMMQSNMNTKNIKEKNGQFNKGFTTTEKLKFNDKKIPGIGLYNIENPEIRAKTPAYVFEKSKRSFSYVDTLSPGPGAFHTPLERSQANRFSIGTAERINTAFQVNQNNPGPGAYEPKKVGQYNTQVGFTIGPSSNRMMDDRDYDEKSREDRKRKERVDEIMRFRKNPIPGPQDYQEVYVLDRKLLQMRIQAPLPPEYPEIQRAYLQFNDNPGPGDYETNLDNTTRQSPSYHIQERPKTQRKEVEDNPGPGEYDPNDTFSKTQGPFFKIGRSQRSNPVRNKYKVGPGSYLVNRQERGNSFSIGNTSRFSDISQTQPGPGQYNISGNIGNLPSYMFKRFKGSVIKPPENHEQTVKEVDRPAFKQYPQNHSKKNSQSSIMATSQYMSQPQVPQNSQPTSPQHKKEQIPSNENQK